MKNIIILFISATALFSCGGNSTSTTTQSNDSLNTAVSNDSISVLEEKISIDLPMLLAKYPKAKSFPYKADSIYFDDLITDFSSPLTGQEVLFLSQSMVSISFAYGTHSIEDFVFIDSLKAIDKYDGYVDTLDLGMTKESDAAVVDKLVLNDSTTLLLWYINYSTYEACPYGHGAYLFASILQNESVISCVQLGENSGGADAPYWGSTLTTFKLTNTGAKITKINTNGGDEDEEGNEIVERSSEKFELILVDNIWMEQK